METPGPERPSLSTIYGGRASGINRRALIGCGLALLATPLHAAGREVKAIGWKGRAHVSVGGRELDLVVHTRIEVPLLFVRSTSWIAAEGSEKARTMVLQPDGAWVEMGGTRRPLPVQLAIHERQQYAIYALLLMAQSERRKAGTTLAISEPPFPDIRFRIGADRYPESAEVTVDAPEEGKPRITQQLRFSGSRGSQGIHWPARIEIDQGGKPYFTLDIDEFAVERA